MAKKILILIFTLLLGWQSVFAGNVSISVAPATIIQGDPVLIQIHDTAKASDIKKVTLFGVKRGVFMYKGVPSALAGVDLNKKIGDYMATVEMINGDIIKQTITVRKRDIVEEPLGIPVKLGGNTKESQDNLVANLAADKKKVTNLKTNIKALWSKAFAEPISKIFVTSPYGYSRKTGAYSIPHKGTDYRAAVGTEIYAVNRGVVRIAQSYTDYGKSVFIDHGLGLVSYYLHLSKYKVKVGQVVEAGQTIGLSGDTGYTLGAHLHLGIRINEVTVDPVKFFELFK